MSAMQIHLVGSVPLDDSAAVFRTVAEGAAGHIHRLPDGETGTRINWVRFIQEQLAARLWTTTRFFSSTAGATSRITHGGPRRSVGCKVA